MSCRIPIALLCCLALGLAEARPAAVPGTRADNAPLADRLPLQQRKEREPGPATLREAVEIAIERYGGREARAETVEREGRRVHEVRLLLEDGSVRTVRINPDTGAILPQPER